MALRGNLKDFSLPDVFQLVTFSRKTGVLRIQREDEAQGSVWFRDGDVFFAQSNWHTEPLGERLVRAQRLTPQALDRALKLRSAEGESGRRLGQILIDEGYITDKVLEAFVSEQIQETIFDLMRWDEGDFDFEAMPEAVEEDIGLSVSIENVIMEGSRRLEEWTRIKKKIPSVDVVFKMATAPGEGTFEISLKPIEWNLLLLVDGTRSVAELAHETDRTDFEVARIIYGLFSAGLLEFATDEEVERLRAERNEREAQLAVIEAERAAAEKAAAAARAASEAAAAQAAEAARGAEAAAAVVPATAEAPATAAPATAPAPAAAPAPETTEPAEVPEFLGGMTAAPTADDAAVLEEMMGAVLQVPAPQAEVVAPASAEAEPAPAPEAEPEPEVAPEPRVPHVPAEDPAFMSVDHLDAGDLTMMPVPSVDELLTDLADLQVPTAEAAAEAASAVAAAFDDTAVVPAEPEPASEEPAALLSLSEALAGLGGAPVAPIIEEPEPEAEPEPEPTPAALVEPIDEPAPIVAEEPEAFEPALLEPLVFEPVAEPASLAPPVAEVAPVVEEPQEAEEPALEFVPVLGVDALNAPPIVVETEQADLAGDVGTVPAVTPDFERDLMSLGLGELPADLFGDATDSAEPEAEVEAEEETYTWVEASAVTPAVSAPQQAEMPEVPDFSELLESLDVEPEPVAIEPEYTEIPIVIAADADFDEELLREVAPAETGGVISTDAFLDDISMDDMDFSGGLTDELSALTGADRPSRPTTNVNKIPEPNSGEVLHRDARVDKDTLLKIIDGIKSL